MKHILLGVVVAILFLIGVGAIGAPLIVGAGTIPFVNGVIGGPALILAVLLAIPLQAKSALETVAPYLPAALKGAKGG